MSYPKIKICGIKSFDDVLIVNKYSPDYVGFVFAEKSKRQISYEYAKALKKTLNPNIKTVGVFVNANILDIVKMCEDGVIDLIQLHGDEDNEFMLNLKQRVNTEIVKAIRVGENFCCPKELISDYYLFDTYVKTSYGGTGKPFNWDVIKDFGNKKFFLAGGINKTNIIEAMKIKPYCLDVSSGVETNGKKDEGKIKELIDIIRKL